MSDSRPGNKANIQELAINNAGDLFATVDTHAFVKVWSLNERCQISSFNALWSLGGRRLHITDSPKPLVITSSWVRGKAAAYDAMTGERLWAVSISHVQMIAPIQYQGSLQLGFATDDKGVQIRDVLTGAYLKNIPGIRKFVQSRHTSSCLLVSRKKRLLFRDAADGALLGESFLTSFAALDAAYNTRDLLLSEAAGPIRCFEQDGRERWRIPPPEKSHASNVCWSEELTSWLALVYHYDRPDAGQVTLCVIDEWGISEMFKLPRYATCEMATNGMIVLASDGCIRSVPSGEIIWRFAD